MSETQDDPSAVFGAAAHEIKNALGPLAMTLQLAERQLLAGQPIAPADMAFARAQVRRLSRLVEDLMDLTPPTWGCSPFARAPRISPRSSTKPSTRFAARTRRPCRSSCPRTR